ncbi:MAG: tetratricopeptide repeat protein [Thermus sp.]|nr:tetratricopeptide repeat protein [Thermus sp.]
MRASGLEWMRGRILMRQRRHEEALWAFGKALELDPRNPAAYRDRGLVYGRMGQWAKALMDLEEALKLAPGNRELIALRGMALVQVGRAEEGVKDLEEGLRKMRDPNPALLVVLAQGYMELDRFEEALEWVERALALDPEAAETRVLKAAIHLRRGEVEEARKELRKVVRNKKREPGWEDIEATLDSLEKTLGPRPKEEKPKA